MTIENVTINNWTGEQYWKEVRSKPDEPMIQATMQMTLSWNEYQHLLEIGRDQEHPTK